MNYFLLKSTRIADHLGILDFEKRLISSGENISSIWTFSKKQGMGLNMTYRAGR